MASENFSLAHPSAGRLRQPLWGQGICLDSTALPLELGSRGARHARDPPDQQKESHPKIIHRAPGLGRAGPCRARRVSSGPAGAAGLLVGGQQAPNAPPRHLGTLGPSQPARARGCWLGAQLAEGVGRLSLQRARQYFRLAGYHSHSAIDST